MSPVFALVDNEVCCVGDAVGAAEDGEGHGTANVEGDEGGATEVGVCLCVAVGDVIAVVLEDLLGVELEAGGGMVLFAAGSSALRSVLVVAALEGGRPRFFSNGAGASTSIAEDGAARATTALDSLATGARTGAKEVVAVGVGAGD